MPRPAPLPTGYPRYSPPVEQLFPRRKGRSGAGKFGDDSAASIAGPGLSSGGKTLPTGGGGQAGADAVSPSPGLGFDRRYGSFGGARLPRPVRRGAGDR